jgi:hypothetical protein
MTEIFFLGATDPKHLEAFFCAEGYSAELLSFIYLERKW